jgi:hypothetical protein
MAITAIAAFRLLMLGQHTTQVLLPGRLLLDDCDPGRINGYFHGNLGLLHCLLTQIERVLKICLDYASGQSTARCERRLAGAYFWWPDYSKWRSETDDDAKGGED